MHLPTLALTLSIAMLVVHSVPTPSSPFSEVDSASNRLTAARRALQSGDLYPPQPPGAGPGKRGLLYNSESNVAWSNFYVESAYVTYGSNGDVIRGDDINTWFSYVPTITVDAKLENSEWKDVVPVLIEGGTKAMFAYVFPTLSRASRLLLTWYTAQMNRMTHRKPTSHHPNVSPSTKIICNHITGPFNSALLPSPTVEVRQA